MKLTDNLINPPHPAIVYMNILWINFWCIYIVCGGGRVYYIIRFYRELLVNPPLRIWYICIVCGGGRVYYIIRFYRELLVNPPLRIWYICIVCGGGRVYYIIRFYRELLVNPPQPTKIL